MGAKVLHLFHYSPAVHLLQCVVILIVTEDDFWPSLLETGKSVIIAFGVGMDDFGWQT